MTLHPGRQSCPEPAAPPASWFTHVGEPAATEIPDVGLRVTDVVTRWSWSEVPVAAGPTLDSDVIAIEGGNRLWQSGFGHDV